jgi:hypothetical protein
VAFHFREQKIRDSFSCGMLKGVVCPCGDINSVGSETTNLTNYHRWIFDLRRKIRFQGTSPWLLRDTSEGTSAGLKAAWPIMILEGAFHVDEPHELRQQGHKKGHHLCSWRCKQRAKEISKDQHHGSLKIP